jgi:hypothetical protein
MVEKTKSNVQIARVLEQIADLLERQEANPFRIQAYRDAARTVRSLEEPVREILAQEGRTGLEALPDIGEGIAGIIISCVRSGRSEMLERLQAETAPADLFAQIPGIGEVLAQRIVEELDVNTYPELEQAAHDGRLEAVDGFGPERVENVRLSLAALLSSAAQRRDDSQAPLAGEEKPSVSLLLDVDRAYRKKAAAGKLRKIAPRRFNPEGEAWLAILETERNGWRFTALFSNTARAHDLNKTDDWVVIYYERDGQEDQDTVVTETSRPLKGKWVVRGRERDCEDYYQEQT